MLGRDVVILTIDDAQAIVAALNVMGLNLHGGSPTAMYTDWQEKQWMTAIARLQDAVAAARDCDADSG